MKFKQFILWNFFIFIQNINSMILSFKGGKIPSNNSHSVIDKPEFVNLVKPPTNNYKKTNIKEIHKPIKK